MKKKEVLAFIFDGYVDWELAYTLPEINISNKYEVKTVAQNKKHKISMGGLKVMPDYTFKNMPKNIAAFILPGGKGWLEDGHQYIEKAVSFFIKKNIPVAAICNGVTFLAKNGYLDNVSHTVILLSFCRNMQKTIKAKKNYIKAQAITGDNLITANGTAALEFAAEIFLKLKVMSEEDVNVWYSFYKKGFYKK